MESFCLQRLLAGSVIAAPRKEPRHEISCLVRGDVEFTCLFFTVFTRHNKISVSNEEECSYQTIHLPVSYPWDLQTAELGRTNICCEKHAAYGFSPSSSHQLEHSLLSALHCSLKTLQKLSNSYPSTCSEFSFSFY